MEQPERKFDLGRAFPNLMRYLSLPDKVLLSSTCKLLRELLMRGQVWQDLQISDYLVTSNWPGFLKWLLKYLKAIQPLSLHLALRHQQH